jgi:hypothetical protein
MLLPMVVEIRKSKLEQLPQAVTINGAFVTWK